MIILFLTNPTSINSWKLKFGIARIWYKYMESVLLTLSCPGMGRAGVKKGHSNLRPGSKELCLKWLGSNYLCLFCTVGIFCIKKEIILLALNFENYFLMILTNPLIPRYHSHSYSQIDRIHVWPQVPKD